MKPKNQKPGARLRIVLEPGMALGPGKIDLLESIKETGSISAAGKRMRMSYRRAWLLVDELNGYFSGPLVEASKGGADGGGAALTAFGKDVLERYRRMEARTADAIKAELAALRRLTTKTRRPEGSSSSRKRRARSGKSSSKE
jgi:molybdate transport system regulatory protein